MWLWLWTPEGDIHLCERKRVRRAACSVPFPRKAGPWPALRSRGGKCGNMAASYGFYTRQRRIVTSRDPPVVLVKGRTLSSYHSYWCKIRSLCWRWHWAGLLMPLFLCTIAAPMSINKSSWAMVVKITATKGLFRKLLTCFILVKSCNIINYLTDSTSSCQEPTF